MEMTSLPLPPLTKSSRPYRHPLHIHWRRLAHDRLNQVYQNAPLIPFDDSDRFIFFSDCHRGDGSPADDFLPNKALFLHALNHYHEQGFTYVEVGDGDECWKFHDFGAIRRAHADVFHLFHQLYAGRRLYLIAGNHDTRNGRFHGLCKDGIPTHEGIRLIHWQTGQEILVVHGHQADFTSAYWHRLSSAIVCHFWRRFASLPKLSSGDWSCAQSIRIEQHLIAWAQTYRHSLICGHTHLPRFAASGQPAYFNTGDCFTPNRLTGLELCGGVLAPVRWGQGEVDGRLHFQREVTAGIP
jgi:UDP-2,3-diacylglucosamine pyrophosphatase LpxH